MSASTTVYKIELIRLNIRGKVLSRSRYTNFHSDEKAAIKEFVEFKFPKDGEYQLNLIKVVLPEVIRIRRSSVPGTPIVPLPKS